VVEHWNSANTVIFYGKDSELTGADREHQEVSMLALHLLQSALIHVKTLLLQRVLAEPEWRERLSDVDRRALTSLFWSNVNPYGRFRLDMERHLNLDTAQLGPGEPYLTVDIGLRKSSPQESTSVAERTAATHAPRQATSS
jgi:hypothetical protein